MKVDKFDVVELKNGNRATIFERINKNQYIAEIVNLYGITLEKRTIIKKEINRVIHKKK